MNRCGQLRDISEVSEVGVTIIQQFRHLGPFTHPLSSSPSVDHDFSFKPQGIEKLFSQGTKDCQSLKYASLIIIDPRYCIQKFLAGLH